MHLSHPIIGVSMATVAIQVVLAKDIPSPIAVEVSPDRVDVIATRIVKLDEKRRPLDAEVVRTPGLDGTGPCKADRLRLLRPHAAQAALGKIRSQMLGEDGDEIEE